ncbi:molecular chaperone DnaJ [Candidatus Microgenomates bacterium]|nr:molecular chaperone DnaJ [Candidatus Microgenomates bacterium]
MPSKDYYQILGVPKSASADDIKRAFKKLAVKYHPDVNKEKNAEEKFKEINEAYQVLSDQEKRSQYDQFGTTDFGSSGRGGFSGFSQGGFDFSGFGQNTNFGGIDDMFDIFFGGARGQKDRGRGRDIEIILQLTFEEAVFGAEKEIAYSIMDFCLVCGGKGGEKLKKCSTCQGAGKVQKTTRTILGSFAQTTICHTCEGRGEIPEITCSKCHGKGKTRQNKDVRVKIPAGVDEDSTIRLAEKGEAGQNVSGDLYLRIKVLPSKKFTREGTDIMTDQEISFAQAVLGDKIKIETIHGPIILNIPAGTKSHTHFVLRGKGVASPTGHGHGDHLVNIIIAVPKNLSREEKELLEKLKKIAEEK